MQKEFYYDYNPRCDLWDGMWTSRTIEQELESCDLETTFKNNLLAYVPPKGKFLDAGCGFGKWVIYLTRLGYDIVGIDNNEVAISKVKEFDSSVQVELGDILNIHYPDNTFDAYISSGVVEHFEDGPMAALDEAYRVLKPGGLILVSVPTVNILRRIIRRPLRKAINALATSGGILIYRGSRPKRSVLMGMVGNNLPEGFVRIVRRKGIRYYHFLEYRYSKSELQNFLKQSGFEIIKTVPHDLYGAKGHAAGLVVDFPFLAASNGANFKLNPWGTLISQMFLKVSPEIACSSVLCMARSLKRGP